MASNLPSELVSATYAELLKEHAARFKGYTLSESNVAIQPALRCRLGGCGCSWNTFVWVSRSRRCIWFEIPKNASSSLKAALSLSEQNPLAFEMFAGTPDAAVDCYPDYHRLAIIREPFDRIQSIYRMFCRSDLEFRHRQLQALFGIDDVRLTLSQFLKKAQRFPNHHWEQMVRFLPTDKSGATQLIRMDENFVETLGRFLEEKLGARIDLPLLNSTGGERVQVDGDEATEQIEMMFAEDLDLYRRRPERD